MVLTADKYRDIAEPPCGRLVEGRGESSQECNRSQRPVYGPRLTRKCLSILCRVNSVGPSIGSWNDGSLITLARGGPPDRRAQVGPPSLRRIGGYPISHG
jgi:hypothetical protein